MQHVGGHHMHEPVDASAVASVGNPTCAFVTGGPREYLAGLNCIGRRLEQVGSKYPLLVMVEPEQETWMRSQVVINSHPNSALIAWRRFPDPAKRNDSWRYRSAHVLDKLNLFGMPFRRLVWIDSDIFVRRNIDALCELPDDVPFAATLDVEGRPNHCWPNFFACKANCSQEYNMSLDATPYVGLRVAEVTPPPSRCRYIMQSGVMMIHPFNLTAFNELIVAPVRHETVKSYDSGDQGLINSLIYGPLQLFGTSYMRLHPMYNVIGRHARHTEQKLQVKNIMSVQRGLAAPRNITAHLQHFTRETRPWQVPPTLSNNTRYGEFAATCGPVVCLSDHTPKSKLSKQQRDESGAMPPSDMGMHPTWLSYCNGSLRSQTAASKWQFVAEDRTFTAGSPLHGSAVAWQARRRATV